MLRLSLAALGVLCAPMAQAATYNMSGLTFETTDRQSTYAPGDASILKGTEFLGETFSGSANSGAIAGKVNKTTIKDISFPVRLAAWEKCRDSIFKDLCGSKPKDGTKTITVDTRTGAELGFEGSGRAGLEFNYELDLGSTAAKSVFDVEATIPDAGSVKVGESFSIGTSSMLSDGRIDVNAPTAQASIDAILELQAKLTGRGCVALLGCDDFAVNAPKIDVDVELIRANPNEIVLLDGIAPDGVEVRIPLADREFALDVEFSAATGGAPTPRVKPKNSGTPDPSIGFSVGEFDIQLPEFDQVGGVVDDHLAVRGISDYIDLTADLDTLLSAFGGIPPLGVTVSGGPLFASLDLLDIDAGPSIDVFHDLKLESNLMVDLMFDKAVEIGGKMVTSYSGAWEALPEFKVFEATKFSPEFYVTSMLSSAVGLNFGLDLTLEALKATAGIGAFGTNLLEVNLGPLVSEKFNLVDFGDVTLADDRFAFLGFDGQRQKGRAFYVTPEGFPSPPAVPLPAAAWMLIAALGSLGLLKRRRVA